MNRIDAGHLYSVARRLEAHTEVALGPSQVEALLTHQSPSSSTSRPAWLLGDRPVALSARLAALSERHVRADVEEVMAPVLSRMPDEDRACVVRALTLHRDGVR